MVGPVLLLTAGLAHAQTGNEPDRWTEAIERLDADTEGAAIVAFEPSTGGVSLIRFGAAGPTLFAPGTDQMDVAERSIARYGDLFGADDPGEQLELVEIRHEWRGTTRVHFRQVHDGVAVFGGAVRVHLDAQGAPLAMSGLAVPDIAVHATPNLGPDEAATLAVDAAAEALGFTPNRPLFAEPGPELSVYRQGLVRGVAGGPTHLVWDVVVAGGPVVREHI